jgi:hypothetical protein
MNPHISRDTPAWIFFAWTSFGLSVTLMSFGIYYMPVQLWIKGYLVMGLFFTIGSTFTLSKMIRDRHEADRAEQLYQDRRLA